MALINAAHALLLAACAFAAASHAHAAAAHTRSRRGSLVTTEQLRTVWANKPHYATQAAADELNDAMLADAITTLPRIRHFIAQVPALAVSVLAWPAVVAGCLCSRAAPGAVAGRDTNVAGAQSPTAVGVRRIRCLDKPRERPGPVSRRAVGPNLVAAWVRATVPRTPRAEAGCGPLGRAAWCRQHRGLQPWPRRARVLPPHVPWGRGGMRFDWSS